MNPLVIQIASSVRWIARLSGLLLFLFAASFVIGEGFSSPTRPTARDAVAAVAMISLFGGLALAWFRPAAGGAVTLGGWILLAVIEGRLPLDWPVAIPAIVGIFHLVSWAILRGIPAATPVWLKPLLYGPLPVFLLLCANEMFGMPPLMARPLEPLATIAGVWRAEGVHLTVNADATVTGEIDGRPLRDGRLLPNRTWFGRLIHWRTEYLIAGSCDGHRAALPLNHVAGGLTGGLDVSGAAVPRSRPLRLERQ